MTQTVVISQPDLVLPASDWGVGVTGSCAGIVGEFTDTDPLSLRTGLGHFKSVNDYTSCGGWAGGRMSNSHATRGVGPFGSFGAGAQTSLPINISRNLFFDTTIQRGVFSFKDWETALDPNALCRIYIDHYIADIENTTNWGEVFICFGARGLSAIPLDFGWQTWNGSDGINNWHGAALLYEDLYDSIRQWRDFFAVPIGHWLNDWAQLWGLEPSRTQLKGVEFGVETSGMTGEVWFDKVRFYTQTPEERFIDTWGILPGDQPPIGKIGPR